MLNEFQRAKVRNKTMRDLCKVIGVPDNQLSRYLPMSSSYRYSASFPEYLDAKFYDQVTFNEVSDAVDTLYHRIKSHRANIKGTPSDYDTCFERNARASCQLAETTLSCSFKTWSGYTVVELLEYADHQEIPEAEKNEPNIVIPIHWKKSVYDNDIEIVEGGKQKHFVLSAKQFNFNRLTRENIQAYSCKSLTVRRNRKRYGSPHEAEMHDGYVMTYWIGGKRISAIHNDFGRAESLLRRRIQDTVMKRLDV